MKFFCADIAIAKFRVVSRGDFVYQMEAFLKSHPLERADYVFPPLFSGEDPPTVCELLKPLYGHAAACKELYLTIRDPPVKDSGGKATALDKSVF